MARNEAMIPVEEKKQEAIRRMKKLGYFGQSINAFRRSGYVMINEPPYGAHYYTHDDEVLQQKNEQKCCNFIGRIFRRTGRKSSKL